MAMAVTENPMASAIVTAQMEIHMVDPYGCPRLNALMADLVPLAVRPMTLAAVQMQPHITCMTLTFPPAYELTTRPCTIHAGRYRWVITANGKPVSTSGDSFETSELAHMDGLIALERLVQSSRINE
jgi:hypothetical protein